jgi:hypothetical protein
VANIIDERVSLRGIYDFILNKNVDDEYSLKTISNSSTEQVVSDFIKGNEDTVTHTVSGKSLTIIVEGLSGGGLYSGNEEIVFTINNIDLTMRTFESFSGNFGNFSEIEITNPVELDYRIIVFS